jgi:hypothetical protein
MSTSQSQKSDKNRVWQTEFGPRRVRHDPPTIEEALEAARDLTDHPQTQVELAASLIGASEEEVSAVALRLKARRRQSPTIMYAGRSGAQHTVVVERRTPRRDFAKRSAGG